MPWSNFGRRESLLLIHIFYITPRDLLTQKFTFGKSNLYFCMGSAEAEVYINEIGKALCSQSLVITKTKLSLLHAWRQTGANTPYLSLHAVVDLFPYFNRKTLA